MLKRASASLLSPKKAKKARTGSQPTIRSFFASSLTTKHDNTEVGSQVDVIDLCLSDEHEDEKKPASSTVPTKGRPENAELNPRLSLSTNDAPREIKPSIDPLNCKPLDLNANPLLFAPNLSVDPLGFPLSPCPWDANSPAPYAFLTHTLVTISSTRSRTSITNTLVNTLRLLIRYDAHRSLLPALYLLSNSLAPSYEGVELNIGPSTINKAIQSVSGISLVTLRSMFHKLGDPGDVAFAAKSSIGTLRPVPPLQLASVHASLLTISSLKGEASAKNRQSIIERLLVAAKGEEVRYLVRMLSLNLRVGAVRTTILNALGRALFLTPPSGEEPKGLGEPRGEEEGEKKKKKRAKDNALGQKMVDAEALVRQVYVRHPHFGHIVDAALKSGLEGLSDGVQLTVGVPLHPTLGSPTRSLDEIYDRLGDLAFTAEFKYDGQLRLELLDSGEVLEAAGQTDDPRKNKNKKRRKPLPATYEPDKRTSAWLKLKKDYVDGLGDSLDLVPIGGWHGIGRKAGWWSPILLGLWDPRAGEFVGVCKCMNFSDAFYKALNERYSEEAGTCSMTPYADVNTSGLIPPTWFKPSEVWEIKAADITLSPISQASKGLVAGDRGLSLRFPRFIRPTCGGSKKAKEAEWTKET
ncbi:DNA ligase, partial [Rhizoctonia solani AG-3 Rhs1AP]